VLYSRADDDHFLLQCFHHIIGDFWSIALVMDELGKHYAALTKGTRSLTVVQYDAIARSFDAFGNCPAEFLQAAFLFLRPVGNLLEKPINFYEHMHQEAYIEDFLTTESWLNDNIPVPGEVYREFVKYLYQQNLLTQNRMPVGKHIVHLQNITCPVLNIMAGKDDLVPCSQGMAFNDLVGSRDRRAILLNGTGHIGLAIGGKAQKEVWPQACSWLADRSVVRLRERMASFEAHARQFGEVVGTQHHDCEADDERDARDLLSLDAESQFPCPLRPVGAACCAGS
jgi:hypothetical protein